MGKIIWFALIGSTVFLGVLIMVLSMLGFSAMNEMKGGPGNLPEIILAVGFLSVMPFTLVRTLLGRKKSSHEKPDLTIQAANAPLRKEGLDPQGSQLALRNLTLLGGIAETPATFGIVYLMLGGTLLWALALWLVSMILMLSLRPGDDD